MYNKFFGFKDKPFEVTPDPKFLYLNQVYREILSALIYGIQERRGFITIVGEVGTGKTMIINALLDRLDNDTKVAFIFNSDLTFRQMLIMALYDLRLAKLEENLSKVKAIQRLNEFAIKQLERGGNVVIIIDEAQGLSYKTMENIRMLSNLETRKHKLVQIILSGQPELDDKLKKPEWRQLVQRISLKRYSTSLSEEDTYRYIKHRLKVAEYHGPSLFSEKALELIWLHSSGIPRKINILCDNMLLIGYGLNKKSLDEEIAIEAIEDLRWSPYFKKRDSFDISGEDDEKFFQKQENTSMQSTEPQNKGDNKIHLIKKEKILIPKKAEIIKAEKIKKKNIRRKATELLEDLELYEEEKKKNKGKRSIPNKTEIKEAEKIQKKKVSRKAAALLEDLELYEEEKEKNQGKKSIFDRIRSSFSSG
jgi:type II secretory pathway predicted ATPase ExeA